MVTHAPICKLSQAFQNQTIERGISRQARKTLLSVVSVSLFCLIRDSSRTGGDDMIKTHFRLLSTSTQLYCTVYSLWNYVEIMQNTKKISWISPSHWRSGNEGRDVGEPYETRRICSSIQPATDFPFCFRRVPAHASHFPLLLGCLPSATHKKEQSYGFKKRIEEGLTNK